MGRTALTVGVVLLVVIAGCAGITPGRRIDVGGYALHARVEGRGSPTVVFDSGLGDPLETWQEVWPQVAKFARVVLYDRAGLGRSDPGPEPRTSARIVAELRALLERAGIQGPYVLVGHSFGGLNVRLFASRYPEDVAGIVLVEATHEDYHDLERVLRPALESEKIETGLALGPPAASAEYRSLDESAKEVREAGPLPDVPLVVIAAGKRGDSDELGKAWKRLQKELAALTPRGRLVVAPDSSHYVQYDAPGLVIRAIREVVEVARQEITGTPPHRIRRRSPAPGGGSD